MPGWEHLQLQMPLMHCCLLKVSSCCQGGCLSLTAHVVHMVGDVIVPSDSLSSATDRSKDSDCCSQNWHRRKYLAAVINSGHFKLQVQLCPHTATGWGWTSSGGWSRISASWLSSPPSGISHTQCLHLFTYHLFKEKLLYCNPTVVDSRQSIGWNLIFVHFIRTSPGNRYVVPDNQVTSLEQWKEQCPKKLNFVKNLWIKSDGSIYKTCCSDPMWELGHWQRSKSTWVYSDDEVIWVHSLIARVFHPWHVN